MIEMQFKSVKITRDNNEFYALDMEGKHIRVVGVKIHKTVSVFDPNSGQGKFYPYMQEVHFEKTPKTSVSGDSKYLALIKEA